MGRSKSNRDDREYDATQYNLTKLAKITDRDYSAHFFRWSFAKKLITINDSVLDIGCGAHKALHKILRGGISQRVSLYSGVDICPLETVNSMYDTFIGEFNFVERWRELLSYHYDVIICLEVIEHVREDLGLEMLRGSYELLEVEGKFVISTPVYDGKTQYDIHVHEYTVEELEIKLKKVGFKILKRFGNHMHIKHLKSMPELVKADKMAALRMYEMLKEYFDNDALSCFFAPLFPDYSKNVIWLCTKE